MVYYFWASDINRGYKFVFRIGWVNSGLFDKLATVLYKNLWIFLIMIGIIATFFSQINAGLTSIQHWLSHFWTSTWKCFIFFHWFFLCLKLLLWTQYMHRIYRFGRWFIQRFWLFTTVVFSYWLNFIIFIISALNCRFFENIALFRVIPQFITIFLLFFNTIKIKQPFLSDYWTTYNRLDCYILRSIFTLRIEGLSRTVFFVDETDHWSETLNLFFISLGSFLIFRNFLSLFFTHLYSGFLLIF